MSGLGTEDHTYIMPQSRRCSSEITSIGSYTRAVFERDVEGVDGEFHLKLVPQTRTTLCAIVIKLIS